MTYVYASGCGTAVCDPESISFLWRNWHYFFKLADKRFSAQQIDDDAWIAKAFGGVGEWHLSDYSYNQSFGHFNVASAVEFFRTLAKGESTFFYAKMPSGRIGYFGVGIGGHKVMGTQLRRLLIPFMSWLAIDTARRGQIVSERICRESGYIERRLGRAAKMKFGEHSDSLGSDNSSETFRVLTNNRFSHLAERRAEGLEDFAFMAKLLEEQLVGDQVRLKIGLAHWLMENMPSAAREHLTRRDRKLSAFCDSNTSQVDLIALAIERCEAIYQIAKGLNA